MSDRSGADTWLDCYRGEEREVNAKSADTQDDKHATAVDISQGDANPVAAEDPAQGPKPDPELEQMMENVKGFIRRIDINDL